MLKTGRVMAIAHRDELIRQAAEKFRNVTGEMPAIEKADERTDEHGFYRAEVVVASIQTLCSGKPDKRRYRKFRPRDFSFLWIDEGHHGTADTYREAVDYFTDGNPKIKVLYVTATPDRADGTGLGEISQTVAFNRDMRDLIGLGYLVPIRSRCVHIEGLDFSAVRTMGDDLNQGDLENAYLLEKPLHGIAHATIEAACGLEYGSLAKIRDCPDVVERLAAMLAGRQRLRTLVFAAGVKHAESLAEIFNRWIPGSARSVSGETDPDDRKKMFAAYDRGEFQFLTNCDVATEGFDSPGVVMVVIARATKSRAKFAQQVGRGTRPAREVAGLLDGCPDDAARREMIQSSDKPAMIVLDFAGNAGKHKLATVADVLGGANYDDAVLARAAELAREADGAEEDVSLFIEQAEEDVALERAAEQVRAELAAKQLEEDEQQAAYDVAKRAAVRATAAYSVTEVDAFDAHDVTPDRDAGLRGGGPSDKQINLLSRFGFRRELVATWNKRQASAVISKELAKRDADRQRQTTEAA
jgi:superfamily II DNA or RNA helicase